MIIMIVMMTDNEYDSDDDNLQLYLLYLPYLLSTILTTIYYILSNIHNYIYNIYYIYNYIHNYMYVCILKYTTRSDCMRFIFFLKIIMDNVLYIIPNHHTACQLSGHATSA